MKKTNNKGFSLVELIIVIAIMAVLMTVLAPQFLRYVEKTRFQKDASAVGELMNATKIALADEDIAQEVTTAAAAAAPVKITVDSNGKFSTPDTAPKLQAELVEVMGSNELKFSSKKFKALSSFDITVTLNATNGFTVSGNQPTSFK